MKNFRFILATLLVSAIGWISCNRDEFPQLGEGNSVTTTIMGMIVDENNAPMAGVSVCVGAKTMLTKTDGVFAFKDVVVPANRAIVCATRTGYFKGSRTMMVRSGTVNQARIMMLQKAIIGSINNDAGGVIETADGVKLTFPSKATGGNSNSYDVSVRLLNATSPDILTMMPGDLRGMNTDDEEQVLASFGMIAVELSDANGLVTNLDESKEVEISIPIPATLADKAPETIPLWYFDEVSGLWAEEGEAKKIGDRYVGKVNHFSFWNCDAGFPIVQLCGQVTDGSNPVTGVTVHLQILSTGAMSSAWVDENGDFCGGIPLDEVLELTVTNSCGEVIHTESVGPFSENITLNSIVVDAVNVEQGTYTVSGTLNDCDNVAVSDGYVVINTDGGQSMVAIVNEDGTFSLSNWFCNTPTTVGVQGYDLENGKQTDVITYPFANEISGVNLLACEDFEYYISYTFDGEDVLFLNPYAGYQGGTYIQAGNNDTLEVNGISFNLSNTDPIPGSYSVSELSVHEFHSMTSSDFVCNITTFGAVGEDIIGTFSGNLIDAQGNPHTISGNFKAVRNW